VADRTGAIERGVMTTTVDTERRGGVSASHDGLLKAPFRTAFVTASVGGTVMEESADRAGLCLFFAQRSGVTKTPTLSALCGFGGRAGGSACAGVGKKSDGVAEPGNMNWVDCFNHRGCALLSPLSLI